jgi:hypothetical protein
MRGVTLRTRLNVSNRETNLQPVIDGVNKLPFAHVGFALGRLSQFNPSITDNWLPLPLTNVLHDTDQQVNSARTKATIADDCDGFYVFQVGTRSSNGSYNFRLRINTTTVMELFPLPTEPRMFACTPPLELRVSDVVSWEILTTNISWTWPGQEITSGNTRFPFLSAHRVGLLP